VIGDAADALNMRGALPGGLLLAVNTVGSILVFAGIYRWAPRCTLRWRSAIVGAVPAGIFIQAVPALVGLYVGNFVGFQAVRLFLTLAIVLLGLYVMATVILVGSGLAVKREVRHLRRVATRPGAPPNRFRVEPDVEAEPEAAAAPGRPPAPTGA
jgi:uncharacterized BrkB/YihY/UPF0761 family membrane protein